MERREIQARKTGEPERNEARTCVIERKGGNDRETDEEKQREVKRGRRRGREEGREGERERERRSEFLPLLRLGVGCLGFHGFTLYLQI